MKRILLMALMLATGSAHALSAYVCEPGKSGFLGIGGTERKCQTLQIQESFDSQCRTESELTFRPSSPVLDYARNENSDFPEINRPKEYYQVEIGIHGVRKSISEASYLVLRRTDSNGKLRLSGCSFYSNKGTDYIDRHTLKLIRASGTSALFEVLQNTESRAFIQIEKLGMQTTLRFVDENGSTVGANLLGVNTPVTYILSASH